MATDEAFYAGMRTGVVLLLLLIASFATAYVQTRNFLRQSCLRLFYAYAQRQQVSEDVRADRMCVARLSHARSLILILTSLALAVTTIAWLFRPTMVVMDTLYLVSAQQSFFWKTTSNACFIASLVAVYFLLPFAYFYSESSLATLSPTTATIRRPSASIHRQNTSDSSSTLLHSSLKHVASWSPFRRRHSSLAVATPHKRQDSTATPAKFTSASLKTNESNTNTPADVKMNDSASASGAAQLREPLIMLLLLFGMMFLIVYTLPSLLPFYVTPPHPLALLASILIIIAAVWSLILIPRGIDSIRTRLNTPRREWSMDERLVFQHELASLENNVSALNQNPTLRKQCAYLSSILSTSPRARWWTISKKILLLCTKSSLLFFRLFFSFRIAAGIVLEVLPYHDFIMLHIILPLSFDLLERLIECIACLLLGIILLFGLFRPMEAVGSDDDELLKWAESLLHSSDKQVTSDHIQYANTQSTEKAKRYSEITTFATPLFDSTSFTETPLRTRRRSSAPTSLVRDSSASESDLQNLSSVRKKLFTTPTPTPSSTHTLSSPILSSANVSPTPYKSVMRSSEPTESTRYSEITIPMFFILRLCLPVTVMLFSTPILCHFLRVSYMNEIEMGGWYGVFSMNTESDRHGQIIRRDGGIGGWCWTVLLVMWRSAVVVVAMK